MADERHENTLSPPPPGHHAQEDPGAHEMEPESDDNFTDAQSQTRSRSASRPESPIPITRVERVDHDAAYGEVPGTDAYEMRTEDARPDEIAFIKDDEKLDSAPPSGAVSPGGRPIPKTVVEEVPASPIMEGLSRRGTLSHKRSPSDAMPDLVLQVEDTGDASPTKSPHSPSLNVPDFNSAKHESADKDDKGTPGSPTNRATRFPSLDGPSDHAEPESHAAPENTKDNQDDEEAEDDDGFGDFDDFEEGNENAEFGDFDEADFQEAEAPPTPAAPVQSLPQIAEPLFPVLDFSNLDLSSLQEGINPYLDALFPPDEIDASVLPAATQETPLFQSQRSASLWSQLVAAPPLQPPNWIRSRIRRLFLVSLGVPVDLDEILPASKQKKLVLPSTGLGSGRNSSDSRAAGGSVQRLKDSENGSRTSLDSQGRQKENRNSTSRRRGPPPEPQLDLNRGRQLCTMTPEAMAGLTMNELKDHVKTLEAMQQTAKECLEYWTKRTDEKLGDREAFEGVIENLVQHARKVRK